MILLQIHVVMVSLGTHLTWVPVQNQRVPVKKKKRKRVGKWKCLGLYICNQTVNLTTHSRAQQSSTKAATEITWMIIQCISTNAHACSDQSINFCVLRDAFHELFCVFRNFYLSRTQDVGVTKSLLHGYLRSEARYGDSDNCIHHRTEQNCTQSCT